MNDTPTTTTDLRAALARIAGLADDAATLSHGAALAILADIQETAEAALAQDTGDEPRIDYRGAWLIAEQRTLDAQAGADLLQAENERLRAQLAAISPTVGEVDAVPHWGNSGETPEWRR